MTVTSHQDIFISSRQPVGLGHIRQTLVLQSRDKGFEETVLDRSQSPTRRPIDKASAGNICFPFSLKVNISTSWSIINRLDQSNNSPHNISHSSHTVLIAHTIWKRKSVILKYLTSFSISLTSLTIIMLIFQNNLFSPHQNLILPY